MDIQVEYDYLVVVQTRVFKSNKPQAVRSPKAVGMLEGVKDADEVYPDYLARGPVGMIGFTVTVYRLIVWTQGSS